MWVYYIKVFYCRILFLFGSFFWCYRYSDQFYSNISKQLFKYRPQNHDAIGLKYKRPNFHCTGTGFSKFVQFAWILAQKHIKLLILWSFWFFWHPWHPWGASIVKISWFLCLFLIFLSGGTPYNFFLSNNSK